MTRNDSGPVRANRPGRRARVTTEPFNVADLVRRARRNADMSQRDLADAIGVSPSTIARAERDGATVTLPVLMAALAQGGIELAAVDDAGDQVIIMRPDALRDRARRKIPAHLDAWIGPAHERDERALRPGEVPPPLVRYAKRRYRDVRRDRHLDSLLYHPAPEDIEIARRRDEADRPYLPLLLLTGREWRPPPECTCSDACVELGQVCPPDCPCQCEGPAATVG